MELNNCTFRSKKLITPLHQTETAGRSQETSEELPAFGTNKKNILLNKALSNRDVKTLKKLLECGANVNAVGDDGDTPLHLGLTYLGIVAFVKKIICAIGFNVNNPVNQALLIRVVSSMGETTIVEELLHNHFGVNAVDSDGNTSLNLVHSEIVQCITELLDHGADVNTTNRMNRTSLHIAALYKINMEVFKALLCHGADVHAVDNDDNTPLHLSFEDLVTVGDIEEMLMSGANFNGVNFENQISLYKAVSSSRHLEIVKELLRYGADINAVDNDGNTPLHLGLASRANGQFIKELLEHAADVTITNHDDETPLHTAMLSKSDVRMVKELLCHGANVNAADTCGNTPLHVGVDCDIVDCDITVECVKELLEHGAEVNVTNHYKETPLHIAMSSEIDTKVIEILLTSGADIHMIDHIRRTPLHCAMHYLCNVDHAKVLVKYILFNTVVHDHESFFNLNQCKHSLNYRSVAQYSNDCVSELTTMKTMKVNAHLSLYDFITITNLNTPLYLDDESSPIFKQEEKLISSFLIYGDIVLPKVKYALYRSNILKKLKTVCIYSWDFNSLADGRGEKIVLNEDCISALAKWLFNDDLCKLIMAFSNCNVNNSESYTATMCLENEKLRKRFFEASTSTFMKKARSE